MVEWWDSFGCSSSWEEIDDIPKPKPMLCRSVGWIVRESKSSVVIVPHIAEIPHRSNQGCGDMLIPKCAIKTTVSLQGRPE